MSGDIHPDDGADFLDEDFVVDELSRGRELEDLFDESAAEERDAVDGTPGSEDEDDVLFTDHTAKLSGDAAWQQAGFDERATSDWNGENLDLESVGVPVARDEDDGGFLESGQLEDARASFTQELDSLLSEEDFALDSEAELEVIGAEPGDGIDEFEQSGPFVLDDGEGLWSDDEAAQPTAAAFDPTSGRVRGAAVDVDEDSLFDDVDAPAAEAFASDDRAVPAFAAGLEEPHDGMSTVSDEADGGESLQELEELPLYEASGGVDDVEELAEGWEPLPGQSMDQLAEVDEVQRSDEELLEEAQSCTAPNYAPVDGADPDLEDVDGHDIYDDAEEEAVVIGGPGSTRGRWASVVGTLLAATVILGGGALVVARPELFGLRIEPQRVERVELPRPRVEFAVVEPPAPVAAEPVAPPLVVAEPGVAGSDPSNRTGDGTPNVETPSNGTPTIESPPVGAQVVESPAVPSEPPSPEPRSFEPPQRVEVLGAGDAPPVAAPVEPSPMAKAWPEDLGAVAETAPPTAKTGSGALARFGDGLLVGELGDAQQRPVRAIDGVLPGSRAFAQLHNGNYFIGSVKQVAAQSVTLRVEDGGEVTLATAEIAQLTELGSTDFDELQKATRGFVRLTNNNRLVGGILSRIADDHVVLEFRKNRVILPRSAVGEIVSEEGDQAVRLDTTREEDGWVRRVVERELGSGKPAVDPGRRPEQEPRSTPPK